MSKEAFRNPAEAYFWDKRNHICINQNYHCSLVTGKVGVKRREVELFLLGKEESWDPLVYYESIVGIVFVLHLIAFTILFLIPLGPLFFFQFFAFIPDHNSCE